MARHTAPRNTGHAQLLATALSRIGPSTRSRVLQAVRGMVQKLSRTCGRAGIQMVGLLAPIGSSNGRPMPRLAIVAATSFAVASDRIEAADQRDASIALKSSRLAFRIITNRPPTESSPRSVLNEIATLPLSLRTLGASWFSNQSVFDDELPQAVYEALVLDGAAALGSDLLDLVVLQVQRVAPSLTEGQALAVLKALWNLASAPFDPYDSSAKGPAASAALVQLVASRPEAEAELARMSKGISGPKRVVALDLLARGARNRGAVASAPFVRLNMSLDLNKAETDRFAEIAETSQRTSIMSREPVSQSNFGWLRRLWSRLGLVATLASAPALVIASVYFPEVGTRVQGNESWVAMPLEGAIAVLALIATINVFTVQLSTQRLPGTVARVAGQPRQLAGAYSTAFMLLLTTLYEPDPALPGWKLLQAVLLLEAVVWLASGMVRIFRRTDPAEACRAYVDRNISRWNRAGRRFGKFQWRGAQLGRSVESLPFATVGSGTMVGHDVVTIEATRRGVLLPDRASAQRVLSNSVFADGGYIQFSTGFGVVVAAGQTVATVRPPATRALPTALREELQRWLEPVDARSVEDVSTQAVTLASLALSSARSGDVRLGEAIAEQAARVVEGNLRSARTKRARFRRRYSLGGSRATRSGGGQLYPANPVLRDVLSLLVTGTKNADDGIRRAADVLFTRCLSASSTDEQAPAMFVSMLSAANIAHSPDLITTWLRRAGLSALSLGHREAFGMVVRQLGRMSTEDAYEQLSMRSLAALGAASARLDPEQFDAVWSEISAWTASGGRTGGKVRLAMQVGAAALESGTFTVALTCARSIVDSGDLAVLQTLTDLDHVFAEAMSAQLMDAYLGRVPTDPLEKFRDFAASL